MKKIRKFTYRQHHQDLAKLNRQHEHVSRQILQVLQKQMEPPKESRIPSSEELAQLQSIVKDKLLSLAAWQEVADLLNPEEIKLLEQFGIAVHRIRK